MKTALRDDGYTVSIDNHQERLRHQAMVLAVDMYKAIGTLVAAHDGQGEVVVKWAKKIEEYLDVKETK